MRLLPHVRRYLGWKLFLTYLIVIVVAGVVLTTATELYLPVAFDRHLAAMAERLDDAALLEADLFAGYRHAIGESLTRAILAATVLALGLSWYISRMISLPIQRMMVAARRIAAGHYAERVEVNGAKGADELGQLAVHFNQMAASLEQTEKLRHELIGNVAHELRTPLTSIKGYMEGLIDGVLPAEEATFERVYREADRLQRLVFDLQELSRVEAGAVPLTLRSLSIEALIGGIVERLSGQFEDKGVAIQTEVAPGLPPVRGDEDRLCQVMLNLAGNALQYTPEGGTVAIRAWREQGWMLVAVKDSGVGIAAEHLPRLFDRFYRVDPSRSRAVGGSGIGLTIAKHLVEAHGGTITAHSDGHNRGSTFTLRLPIGQSRG